MNHYYEHVASFELYHSCWQKIVVLMISEVWINKQEPANWDYNFVFSVFEDGLTIFFKKEEERIHMLLYVKVWTNY